MKKIVLATLFFMAGGFSVADSSYYIVPEQPKPPTVETVKQICNVSAYSADVRQCGKADGITASGEKAVEGRTIACDHLPFGTIVIINGHEYTVTDRFGGGYHDRLDIYFENEQDAWDFGRREIEVEIKL